MTEEDLAAAPETAIDVDALAEVAGGDVTGDCVTEDDMTTDVAKGEGVTEVTLVPETVVDVTDDATTGLGLISV